MSTSLVNKERFIPSRLSNLAMWLDARETSTITVSATTGGVTSWADRSSNGNTMVTSTFSIPGCALWLDAADQSTMTFSPATTNVTQWRDKSGNGRNATPGAAVALSATAMGGYPAMTFAGSQYFQGSVSITGTSYTSFVVGSVNGANPAVPRILALGAAGQEDYNNNSYITITRNSGSEFSIFRNGTTAIVTLTYGAPTILTTGADSLYNIYASRNGETRASKAFTPQVPFNITTYTIGNNPGALGAAGGNSWLQGYVSEVIIFNTDLTTPQRQQVEAYLSKKWNIPLSYSIPSVVPVFSLPPIISNTTTNQPSIFVPKGAQMISTLNSRLGAPTIPGCLLWLDAADASTIVFQSGTNMSQWIDKSGNGNHGMGRSGTGTTVSTTGGPNYASTTNGITFNGNQFFIASSLKISTETHCLFAVHNPTIINGNATGNTRVFSFQGQGGSAFVIFPYMLGTTPRGYVNSAPGAQAYTSSTLLENSVAGQKNLIVANIAATSQLIFKNGAIQNSATSSITVLETSRLSIGRFYNSTDNATGEGYQGTIHELMVFNTTLTSFQRQQVEGYLAWKWGVQISETTHPYYSVPYTGPFTLNPTTPISKSFIAVYQCPTLASAMNVGIGCNINSSAFGICQSNNVLYSPYQYAVGDLSFGVTNYTEMKYTFASFDVSTNILSGIPGFNDLSTAAVAFQNKAVNTPFYISSSTTLYTSTGFHLCEFIATSNALSATDRQNVEGYLASKWGLLDQLPFSHPYKNFQPSGDEWIPPTLPSTVLGLVSWLDMTHPGQTTSTIVDRVGGSFTVNVGSGNQFQLSNINNLPSLYFPGNTTNYLYKNSLPPTAEGSVLFVFNITDTRSDLPILTWGASSGTAPWGPLLTCSGGTTLKLQNNYAGATGGDTTPLTLAMTSGTNIVFFAWDYSNFYLSVNGGTPVVGVNAIPGSAQRMYIGGNVTGSFFPTMNFGELVVYNQYFEQSERQLLEGYLAWKWSLVTKLPGSHPFSKQSPTGATVIQTSTLNIPSQIASLTTWLDAADSATIVLTGGTKVSRWNDKSATSDVFLAPTTTAPTYSNTNGPYLPGVYFSGENALRGTVSAAIASGIGTCFMLATISGNNAQVFTGDFVSATNPAVGRSFGLVCGDKSITSPLQSDARENRNPLPGTLSTTTSILYSQMNAAITSKIGVGSYDFTTPTNVVSIVNNQSVSWQPSVPSTSPWNLGYLSKYNAQQDFYLHEFLCFSEYFTESQRFVVEGYLAWKWRIQSQLPMGHPYKNIRPIISTIFTPNSVAGLRWWVDGMDTSTMTFSSGSSITEWRDKSGNGYHATGVNSPQKISSGGVSFNAASSQRFTMSVPYSKTNTVFMVASPVSSTTANMYYMDTNGTGNRGTMYLGGYNSAYVVHYIGLNDPAFGNFTSGLGLPTTPFLVSSVKTSTVSSVGFYNGGQAFSIADNNLDSATSWSVLGGAVTGVAYVTANIYEMIIFNTALNTSQREQVEGYLAWKWGLQSSLPLAHPYKSAAPTAPIRLIFTPTSIAGCQLWLDAADSSTITGTTSVTAWNDKSGNGLNATKSTSYGAPTYSATGFNTTYPGLLFDGATGTMLVTPSILPTPVLSANGTDTTIFVVFNRLGSAANSVVYGLGGPPNGTATINTYVLRDPWQSSGNSILDIGSAAGGRLSITNGATGPQIYSLWRSGTSVYFYKFGAEIGSVSSATGNVGTTSQPLNIGGGFADSQWFNSYISEFIIFNIALTTSQRQQVEGYLAWKWGLQSSLQSTHPYAKFAP